MFFSLVGERLLLHVEDRMALFKFFKRDSPLPKPDGPLSAVVPSTSIAAANRKVEHLLKAEAKEPGKRGRYDFFTPEEKAQIGRGLLSMA